MIGTTLLHYRIVGRLGAGAMGEVYAAEDTLLQRRVALKLLPPDMAADPERLQRFQREARAVAALSHPNVVTVYSVEESDGVHFLTMELVEGRTLAEAIPDGGLPLDELLALAVPLVDAVAAAHEHGIVHRDLKPANVMLGNDGRLKVLDFGLAKLRRQTAGAETTALATQSTTGQHTVLGTAAYMSPEQAEGRPVDHRTDIFSLGVIVYEMTCGTRPFGGDTLFSVISSIVKDPPPPLSAVNRSVSSDLERIVRRALAKDPAERYQHAFEMRDDLRLIQSQTATRRRLAGVVRTIGRSRWARRVAFTAGVTALVAGAAVYLPSLRDGSRDGSGHALPEATFRRLTAQSGIEQFPSLMPDGKWVVYAGEESGNRDIYLLSTSDQNPINLTGDSPADDDEPAVSADGERIAFRSSREGGGIFVMGRTGEGVRRVTPTGFSSAFNPTWSPDGTEIAFSTEDVQLTPLNWEGEAALWVVDVATSAQRPLGVVRAVQPSWSPHGHRIAFVSRLQAERVMDIWTIPARGGDPVALTSDEAADWSPVWSPDGGSVYFVSDRGGSMNLWRIAIDEISGRALSDPEPVVTPASFLAHPTISADGRLVAYSAVTQTSNIQKLPLDPVTTTVESEPTWVTKGSRLWANPDPTPDGEWVVFYSRDQPEGDLYVCRPDGTGLRQLTADEFVDRVPRWSPDKAWVTFFSNRSGPLRVWKIRVDGSGLQQVADSGGISAWSPDGTQLALGGAGAGAEARLLDPNHPETDQTSRMLPLPDQALRPFIPNSWSPDGTMLAGQIGFTAGGTGIVVYKFTSRSYERLTAVGEGEYPVWFAGSRRLLYVSKGREFWVLDTLTKTSRRIYASTRDVLGPPRLTRDGRLAFYSRRMTQADLYLLTFH